MLRRATTRGLVLTTLTLAAIASSGLAEAASRRPGKSAEGAASVVPAAPSSPEARRHWALARMSEAAAERRRCSERFRAPADVRDCEARFTRQYRAFNEIYIEASR